MIDHVVCTVWPPATLSNEAGVVGVTVHPAGAVRVMLTLLRGALLGLGSVVVAVRVEPATATPGALRVYGCLTTMTAEPCTPFTVTLIVATPAPTAFTRPPPLTVATEGLLVL